MICDHAAGLLTARFLQRIHKPCQNMSPLPDPLSLGNGISGDANTPIEHSAHRAFLLKHSGMQSVFAALRNAATPYRFTMMTSRYSLGTIIVPLPALFMRATR